MVLSKRDWEDERQYLQTALIEIEHQLLKCQSQVKKSKSDLQKLHKSMWKNAAHRSGDAIDFADAVQVNQYLVERQRQVILYQQAKDQLQKLEKIKISPYFGRVDFLEVGKDRSERVYIGISTVIDEQTWECLISDWRAPISSLFYDYELGPVKYKCHNTLIAGEMLLKRQYKIKDGRLQYMFDTNLKIDDEILQEILSKNATGKMKNIVLSIQREQNKVIREENHKLLIVQGPAGSGKTSIALHRVAFLLYKYKQHIKSHNILVFSPNQVFCDYISNVLPELGEENMLQLTFQEYAEKYLSSQFELEDVYDQLEYFYSQTEVKDQVRLQGAHFKSSLAFISVVKKYINFLEDVGVNFSDIVFDGQLIISEKEFWQLWRKKYSYLPFSKRLKKIRRRILRLLKPVKKAYLKRVTLQLKKRYKYDNFPWFKEALSLLRKDLAPLKKYLNNLVKVDYYQLYRELFENEEFMQNCIVDHQLPDNFAAICQQTQRSLAQKMIFNEDLPPLIYLKRALSGEKLGFGMIKHVFIDEAQDYSPFQYQVIQQLFSDSNFTLLGDLNQAIHPYQGIGDYHHLGELLNSRQVKMINLKKSYRSTSQISAFCRQLLPPTEEVVTVERFGPKPQVVQVLEKKEMPRLLVAGIKAFQAEGAKSIAVICKTAVASNQVFQDLRDRVEIDMLTKDADKFAWQTVVIPAYLAKGLEFDAVLIYISEISNYQAHENKLFYTICSRALHGLKIYFTGERPFFLGNVNGETYEYLNSSIATNLKI